MGRGVLNILRFHEPQINSKDTTQLICWRGHVGRHSDNKLKNNLVGGPFLLISK